MFHSGLMGSSTSLTNLTNEADYSLPRCRSATELYDPSSGSGGRHSKAKHRARDLRHSIADSSSDYYNNRRPQSMSLSSQIPAFSNLQSASSISALGTISENEALCGSPHTPFNSQTGRDSIFAEPPETPIFNYNPTALPLVESSIPTRVSSSGPQRHTRLSQTLSNQGPQMTGSGNYRVNGYTDQGPQMTESGNHRANGYTDSSTAAPIHTSEPVAQEFVPIYLNPLTGQMYSHSHDYFRPITGVNDLIASPPKPVCSTPRIFKTGLFYFIFYRTDV